MVQEFRYLTPGGLFIFFALIGACIVDSNIIKIIGGLTGIFSILIAIPVGWLLYQWLAYLTYSRGGVESYREVEVLRKLWENEWLKKVCLLFMNTKLIIEKDIVSQKISELGHKYYSALGKFFPDFSIKLSNDTKYFSILHDIVFFAQKEHDQPRGMYGIHNTLSMLYYVIGWGLNFLVISFIMRFIIDTEGFFKKTILIFLILSVAVILLHYIGHFMDIIRAKTNNLLPSDHIVLFVIFYALSGPLTIFGVYGYLIIIFIFMVYIIQKSRVPSAVSG